MYYNHTMSKTGVAIMPLAKVKMKGQVTIPAGIREEVGLREGDYVEVTREGNRVVLTPKDIVDRDPATEAAIAEGLADARAGRVSPQFQTAEEIKAWQQTPEYKRLIGKA
jgi:AbrB family looped-hinge helix DNA binding protein